MTEIEKINEIEAKEALKYLDLSLGDKTAMEVCFTISSMIWRGRIDGKLACIWGLIPRTILSHQAYLWLYTTDVIAGHQFIFVRHSQLVMEKMLEEYSPIVGHAMVGNHRSICWLKWLGAEFGHPQGLGLPFKIMRH